MEADVITFTDRPAGLAGSLLRGLASASVALAFLAGIVIGAEVLAKQESGGGSSVRTPGLARAAITPKTPPGGDAFSMYIVSSTEQRVAVQAAFERMRRDPSLRGVDADAVFLAEGPGAQQALEMQIVEINSVRRTAGLPDIMVVDLRTAPPR